MNRSLSATLVASLIFAAATAASAGQMPPTRPGRPKLPPAPCSLTSRCAPSPAPCQTAPRRGGCLPRMPPTSH